MSKLTKLLRLIICLMLMPPSSALGYFSAAIADAFKHGVRAYEEDTK